MMIHKIPSILDYNYWLKRFDTQLDESTKQNLIKVSKETNKNVIIKPNVPSLPGTMTPIILLLIL